MKKSCPKCQSTNIIRNGHGYGSRGEYQRYQCRDCKSRFQDRPDDLPEKPSTSTAEKNEFLDPEQYLSHLVQNLQHTEILSCIPYENPFHGKQHESAVLLLSDCQIGRTNQIMDPLTGQIETTYNTEIFVRESQNLIKSLHRIVDLLSPSYQIDVLYIFALGDLVDNDLIFRGHKFFIDMDSGNQLWKGTAIFADMFRAFLKIFPRVEIFSVPGNHGRMTERREACHASRNFDYHFMRILEVIFQNEPRIKFNIPPSYFAYPRIYDHRYMLHHGDDVFSWMSLPYYGIVRKSTRRRTELNFDIECIGHWHTTMEVPNSSHCYTLVNGGWIPRAAEVWEKYGHWSRAEQTFFGVSPKYARTWSFTINIEE